MQKFLQKKFLGISYLLFLILLLTTLLAFFLRVYLIPQNLFIGPEQGRDLLVVKDIVMGHKLTLIGPKTDIGGIFHGPLFYYLLTIPFFVSSGDPLVISIFLIIIQAATTVIIYLLGKKLFNDRVGVISSILFAISFGAISYARWLSNPPLSIPLVVLTMLFLSKFLKGSKKSLLGYSICLGLLNQAEFLNIIFYVVITIIFVIIFFKRFRETSIGYLILNLLITGIITVGSFILFDIRHQFLIAKSVVSLLTNQTGYHISFIASVQSNIAAFLNAFTSTIFPFYAFAGVVIFLISFVYLIIRVKKQRGHILLLVWLLTPLLLLIILHHDVLDQFFVSLIPVFIILVANMIDMIWDKSKLIGILLLIIFVAMQLFTWAQNIPVNKNIFFQSTQLELRYSDELRTIDRVYRDVGDKSFAIQAYTIPYWSQEGWTYLFWSYGSKKYGKSPIAQNDAKKLFVIVQSDPRNSLYQKDWLKNTVSKWGSTEKIFRYGVLTTRELKSK